MQVTWHPDTVFDDNRLIEITQSAVTTFLTCEQKYAFRYLFHIAPQGTSIYFTVGTAVHKALEILLKGGTTQDALAGIDGVFDEQLTSEDSWSVDVERLESGRWQAHAIINAWWLTNKDLIEEYQILTTETVIRAVKDANINSPLFARMAGVIDGLAKDKNDNVWILEHKTRSSIADQSYLASLDMNLQTAFYALLLGDASGKGLGATYQPLGFLYNAMAKPLHRKFTGQQRIDYMTTEILVDPDKYFAITPVILDPNNLERARRHLTKIVRRMDGLCAGEVVMNTTSCDDYGGCPYRNLCRAGADANNPAALLSLPQLDLYTVVQPHGELERETGE